MCAKGYIGNNCENTAGTCTNGANGLPCQNGNAVGTAGQCKCACDSTHIGDNCESLITCTQGYGG